MSIIYEPDFVADYYCAFELPYSIEFTLNNKKYYEKIKFTNVTHNQIILLLKILKKPLQILF